MMKISVVVAKSKNNVIGKNNQLPWHLPADLKHFKNITMGKPIIMWRKTFESIGKPLVGRRNIIVSRNKELKIAGCEICHSIEDALNVVKMEKEVMIIGGANLFSSCLSRVNCVYLTLIDAEFEGDTFFNDLNVDEWQLVFEENFSPDEKNSYPYSFQVFERRR